MQVKTSLLAIREELDRLETVLNSGYLVTKEEAGIIADYVAAKDTFTKLRYIAASNLGRTDISNDDLSAYFRIATSRMVSVIGSRKALLDKTKEA